MILASPLTAAALAAVVVAASVTDLRSRRVPNALIVVGLVAAIGSATAAGGLRGTLDAAAGAALGLAIALPFFALRMVGAGDAKLLAVVGAFVGTAHVGGVAFNTAVAGVAVALACWLVARRSGRPAGTPAASAAHRVPYALAIALGTAWTVLAPIAPA